MAIKYVLCDLGGCNIKPNDETNDRIEMRRHRLKAQDCKEWQMRH